MTYSCYLVATWKSAMSAEVLDKLLTTLSVRLNAFAVCEIQDGYRLGFDPHEAVTIHYVLSGKRCAPGRQWFYGFLLTKQHHRCTRRGSGRALARRALSG
jgi:hypothetical protein